MFHIGALLELFRFKLTIMSKNDKSTFLPFSSVLLVSVLLSTIIELIIVTYNHFTGYSINHSAGIFIFKWLYGTVICSILAPLIIYPDLFIIQYLKRSFWQIRGIFSRFIIEFLAAIIFAIAISSMITFLSNFIYSYTDGFLKNLINNTLITIVINIILIISMESWISFQENRIVRLNSEKLEKELMVIKFEVLKNQLNPHFLFNSLNVLSSLVGHDTAKAQLFIDEFAQVYRYVLETIEKPLVTLVKELEFSRSFMYLQQIRYGESLKFEVNVDSKSFNLLMPPLCLQLVLENAIKHNMINDAQPLLVKIYEEPGWLVVQNNIQRKISIGNSMGIGQNNLMKRYKQVSNKVPIFLLSNKVYLARLPLIEIDNYESSDY